MQHLPSGELVVAYILIVALLSFDSYKSHDLTRQKSIDHVKACMVKSKSTYSDGQQQHPHREKKFKIIKTYGQGTVLEFANIISREDVERIDEMQSCIEKVQPAHYRDFGEDKGKYNGNQVTFLNKYLPVLLPDIDMKIENTIHAKTIHINSFT